MKKNNIVFVIDKIVVTMYNSFRSIRVPVNPASYRKVHITFKPTKLILKYDQ